MNVCRLALRQLVRERRSVELRLIVLALIIAAAAVSTVSFFTDRVDRELQRQPARFIAADLVVESGLTIPAEITAQAREHGLRTAATLKFRSMLAVGEEWQLVEVKAVDTGYPLRGELLLYGPNGQPRPAGQLPDRKHAWVDRRLRDQLPDTDNPVIKLGELTLTVSGTLAAEPDRGGDMFHIAPRVMIHADDVPATELLVPGSRVKHGLLLAGDESPLADMRRYIEELKNPQLRVVTANEAQQGLQSAMKRARQFLGLTVLITVALAGLALAMAAQSYTSGHLDQNALLRCLGAGRGFLLRFHAWQLLWLAVLSAIPGSMLGYGGQAVLARLLSGISMDGTLPEPSLMPWLITPISTLVVLIAFHFPYFRQLYQVPPIRVLRRDHTKNNSDYGILAGTGLIALLLLAPWPAGDPALSIWLLISVVGVMALFGLAAWALIAVLKYQRLGMSSSWLYGLANIARRPDISIFQLIGTGTGLGALLILMLVHQQLLEEWRAQLPENTPNYFMINIQPQQRQGLQELLQEQTGQTNKLYPMVRGRLTAINDRPVRPEDYPEGRDRRLVQRVFNLSWLDQLPADNRLLTGTWWQPDDDRPLWSVEEDMARILGVGTGDTLTYRIGEREVTGTVTNTRSVQWDSFQVNFFVAANPGWLHDYPATWITSIYVPPERLSLLRQITQRYSNITIFDIDALLRQVRTTISQVSSVLEFLFLFTLAAGLLILIAALYINTPARRKECAVLRALGASRTWLMKGHATEFAVLGLLAGLLAVLSAEISARLLATHAFQMEFHSDWRLWLVGFASGLIIVTSFGLLVTRPVRRHPPVRSLR